MYVSMRMCVDGWMDAWLCVRARLCGMYVCMHACMYVCIMYVRNVCTGVYGCM